MSGSHYHGQQQRGFLFLAAFLKIWPRGLLFKLWFSVVPCKGSFIKNSFNIAHTCLIFFLAAAICYNNFPIFRGLSSNYINLSKFKSRPWRKKKKNGWAKCKNSSIVSFNLTYKINVDFILGCIVIFKRLLILEVILLSLWLVSFKQ